MHKALDQEVGHGFLRVVTEEPLQVTYINGGRYYTGDEVKHGGPNDEVIGSKRVWMDRMTRDGVQCTGSRSARMSSGGECRYRYCNTGNGMWVWEPRGEGASHMARRLGEGRHWA